MNKEIRRACKGGHAYIQGYSDVEGLRSGPVGWKYMGGLSFSHSGESLEDKDKRGKKRGSTITRRVSSLYARE